MSIEKDLGIDEALYHKCGLGLDYVEVEMLSNYLEELQADRLKLALALRSMTLNGDIDSEDIAMAQHIIEENIQ